MPVKWIDRRDGGWKVGQQVIIDGLPVFREFANREASTLVQHAHTGQLEFVPVGDLQEWPSRATWEK